MVLGIRKEGVGGTVHQGVDRALGSSQEFLDHHGITGRSENLFDHRLADRLLGLFARLRDHDPLAEGKSIGLHDERVEGDGTVGEGGLRIGEG